jgi:hypothetical protein
MHEHDALNPEIIADVMTSTDCSLLGDQNLTGFESAALTT